MCFALQLRSNIAHLVMRVSALSSGSLGMMVMMFFHVCDIVGYGAPPSQGNPDPKESPGCPRVGTLGWRPWPVGDVSTSHRTETEASSGLGPTPDDAPQADGKLNEVLMRRDASCISLVLDVPLALGHGGPYSP